MAGSSHTVYCTDLRVPGFSSVGAGLCLSIVGAVLADAGSMLLFCGLVWRAGCRLYCQGETGLSLQRSWNVGALAETGDRPGQRLAGELETPA